MSEQFDFTELHAVIEEHQRAIELSRFDFLARELHRRLVQQVKGVAGTIQIRKVPQVSVPELCGWIAYLTREKEKERK